MFKYDTSGKYKWSKNIATSNEDAAYVVAASSTGYVYVVGITYGTLPGQTKKGGRDAFVRKYDAYGNVKWTKQFRTYYRDGAKTVSAASSEVYTAGITEGAFLGYTNKGGRDVFISKIGSP